MESRLKKSKTKITKIRLNTTMRPGEAVMFRDGDTLHVAELEFNSLLRLINESMKIKVLNMRQE